MQEYDILIITLVGSLTSIILLSLKLCFKSKCSECALCYGCIKIKRDVRFEAKLEAELEEQNGQKKLCREQLTCMRGGCLASMKSACMLSINDLFNKPVVVWFNEMFKSCCQSEICNGINASTRLAAKQV